MSEPEGRRRLGTAITIPVLVALLLIAVVLALRFFPFPSTSPPQLPAHLNVEIHQDVGELSSVVVSVLPRVHGTFTVEARAKVAVSSDAAAHADDIAYATMSWPVVLVPSIDEVGPHSETWKSELAYSQSVDTFTWTMMVRGDANGVSTIDDTVLFGLPDVGEDSLSMGSGKAYVDRYLVDAKDWASLAWTQNAPNRHVAHTSMIGWANARVTPGDSTGSTVAQGTDLAIANATQVRLFLSGAFIGIAGGALVALVPEIARAVQGRRPRRR